MLVDDDMLAPGSTFNDDVRRLAHDNLFAYASLVEQVSFSSVIVSHPTPHEPYTLTVKSGVCVRVKLQISMTYPPKKLAHKAGAFVTRHVCSKGLCWRSGCL